MAREVFSRLKYNVYVLFPEKARKKLGCRFQRRITFANGNFQRKSAPLKNTAWSSSVFGNSEFCLQNR